MNFSEMFVLNGATDSCGIKPAHVLSFFHTQGSGKDQLLLLPEFDIG